MILQTFKRLVKTDYQQQWQSLVDQMSFIVNQMESLYQAFTNNISLTNNLNCTVATLTVTVDSSGNPTTSTAFQINFSPPVLGCIVLNATFTGNTTIYPTSGVFISYTATTNNNNNIVTINNITGLPAGQQFSLTIVAFSST